MNWIKLMCNILDHRKIKLVRHGPEGNTLVLLWLLILVEAGKCSRGGYLMVSDNLPYTPQALSMITDISLPTVQLGLQTFSSLDMIDQRDGAIFVKNWGKYQSEDKLEKRRKSDKERQQRCRQNEKERQLLLPGQKIGAALCASRDSHDDTLRDITEENRTDNIIKETTTEDVRLLLYGTGLIKISESELQDLSKRHGIEHLASAADVAAETWRRKPKGIPNPGGYLQSLCINLVMPEWYISLKDRLSQARTSQESKAVSEAEKRSLTAQEEMQSKLRNSIWDALSEGQRKMYREEVLCGMQSDMPVDILPDISVTAMAKLLAWETASNHDNA